MLGFGKDPKDLYISANHEGRLAVFKVDLSKADLPRQLILSHPVYDIEGSLIYSAARDEPVGIYFSDESSRSLFWDEEFKAFQAGLDKALPDTVNYITNLSSNDRSYLLYATNATTYIKINPDGTLSNVGIFLLSLYAFRSVRNVK